MKLKVAASNMGHWMHRGVAQQAWNYLEKEIAADISLVQESAPPIERQKELCVWREIDQKRKWGSGVLTKALPVTEIKLERNDYPGALVVANVTLPDNSTLVVVSMYGQLDKYGYSITTLHRMLSDLTHLFEGELRRGGRPEIILGWWALTRRLNGTTNTQSRHTVFSSSGLKRSVYGLPRAIHKRSSAYASSFQRPRAFPLGE